MLLNCTLRPIKSYKVRSIASKYPLSYIGTSFQIIKEIYLRNLYKLLPLLILYVFLVERSIGILNREWVIRPPFRRITAILEEATYRITFP